MTLLQQASKAAKNATPAPDTVNTLMEMPKTIDGVLPKALAVGGFLAQVLCVVAVAMVVYRLVRSFNQWHKMALAEWVPVGILAVLLMIALK